MVAQERYQSAGIPGRGGVVTVLRKELRQRSRTAQTGGKSTRGMLKSEIEHRRKSGPVYKFRKERRIRVVNLSENKKIFPIRFPGSLQNGRNKSLPELVVDVFDSVEAKPGNREVPNPIDVD